VSVVVGLSPPPQANLYGAWHCVAQRPHHLCGVLLRAGWAVDVFTHHTLRDRPPVLPCAPRLRSRMLPPGRLDHWSLLGDLVRSERARRKRAVLDDFSARAANLYVHYRRPHAGSAPGRALPGPLVYDCMDDWEGFTNTDNRCTPAWEAALCERADQIWVVSRQLQDKLAHWADKVLLVPNGVDYPHFATSRALAVARPPRTRPRLIYIGTLDRWFDAGLVGAIAARLAHWQIDLVGPSALDATQLRCLDRGNVSLLGRREYADLPGLLADSDVAMIPFVINRLVESTSPIKLYEYLAAGLPVVATPMREVLPHVEPGVVTCADDASGFVAAIEALAARPAVERCQAVARECSWESRFLPAVDAAVNRG
jgi:glycosyltransferase involved in cell wall biosynthesis